MTSLETTDLREPLATADVRGKLERKALAELRTEAARLRDSIAKREELGVPAILGQPERLHEVAAHLAEKESVQQSIRGEVARIYAEAEDHCESLVALGRDADAVIVRNHALLRGEPNLTMRQPELATIKYLAVVASSSATKLTRALEYLQA